MPSYLSSTQTGGGRRASASASSTTGDASMTLSGWKSARRALSSASARASSAVAPMSPVSMPAHWTAASSRPNALAIAGLEVALAQADAQLAREDRGDVAPGQRVAALEERRAGSHCFASRPRAAATDSKAAATSASVSGGPSAGGWWPAAASRSPTAVPRSDERSYAALRASRRRRRRPRARPPRSPTSPGRSCAGRAPGTAGRRGRRPRSRGRVARANAGSQRRSRPSRMSCACARTASAVSAQRRIERSKPGSRPLAGMARHASRRSALRRAVASAARWCRLRSSARSGTRPPSRVRAWSCAAIAPTTCPRSGAGIATAELARLTRYSLRPMGDEEIDRFFQSRLLSPETVAYAIVVRAEPAAHRPDDVQQPRPRQRQRAVPHQHRRARRVGPRLRHGGDRADARAGVRAHRAAPRRPVGVQLQHARDPRVREGRLPPRGTRARGDHPRRAPLGRADDGHPPPRVAGAPTPLGPRSRADGEHGRRPPTRRARTCARSPRGRATRSTTRASGHRPARGGVRGRRAASGRRSSTRRSATSRSRSSRTTARSSAASPPRRRASSSAPSTATLDEA